jgi:hypothetical protein
MSMTAIEIQRDKWRAYFEEIAKEYQGWAVTIDALEGELGDQPVADGLPLQGISFETKGSASGDILIEVGDIGTPFAVHRVNRPRIVRAADTIPGVETDIQIDSEDGTSTLIRLRVRPALPPKSARSS